MPCGRVIALLSDFGTRDHYAGTMKGVMLGICPDADARRHHPRHPAARRASKARCSWPPPTGISRRHHLSRPWWIPGVGSARRGIAAEAGDYRFVAPDNGVLTAVFRTSAAEEDRRADGAALRAADGQPHIRGARPIRAGGRMAGQGHPARRARPRRCRPVNASTSRARRNEPTSVARRRAARRSLRQSGHQHRSPHVRARWRSDSPIDIDVGGQRHRAASSPPTPTSAPGEICALFGSTDHLEIAANGGSAGPPGAGAVVIGRGDAGSGLRSTPCGIVSAGARATIPRSQPTSYTA